MWCLKSNPKKYVCGKTCYVRDVKNVNDNPGCSSFFVGGICDGAWMGQKISAKQLKTSEGGDSSCANFASSSLSRSSPSLQGNFNQCETEWCNHHFFSVTIILPGEGLRMSVFHLCTRLCTNLAIVG